MSTLKRTFFAGLTLLNVLMLAACSTHKQKESPSKWIDVFAPTVDDQNVENYGMERVEKDYTRLTALSLELNDIANETAVLKGELLFQQIPYVSDEENKQIELLIFRFRNASDALLDMADYYRHNTSPDISVHTRGAILGMSAALHHACSSSRLVALYHDEDKLIDILNEAHPSYGIPEGFYDAVAYNVTAIDNLEQINVSWHLFCKTMAKPNSQLSENKRSDPRFAQLITDMDRLHAELNIQMEYLLYAKWSAFPELKNRMSHNAIANISRDVMAGYDGSVTAFRGFLFKNVARMKSPTAHVLTFTAEQITEIKSLLQPGDILLTYTAGYMSDVFLPGNFKHGITYIGTVE